MDKIRRPPIHVTWSGTGKMRGKISVNDDPWSNPYCMHECEMRSHCYAKFLSRIFKNVRSCFSQNGELMSRGVLPDQILPRFVPGDSVRLHSYGEYRNETHLQNHVRIAQLNPATYFDGWSHRDDMISKLRNIPENLRFIHSARLNEIDADIPDNFSGVYIPVEDHVAEAEGIELFCTGQDCAHCNRCYNHKHDQGVIYAKFRPYSVGSDIMPILTSTV